MRCNLQCYSICDGILYFDAVWIILWRLLFNWDDCAQFLPRVKATNGRPSIGPARLHPPSFFIFFFISFTSFFFSLYLVSGSFDWTPHESSKLFHFICSSCWFLFSSHPSHFLIVQIFSAFLNPPLFFFFSSISFTSLSLQIWNCFSFYSHRWWQGHLWTQVRSVMWY